MRKTGGFLAAVVAFAWMFALTAGAQTFGSIEGVVKDKAGSAVAGAWVMARNAERGLMVTVVSQEGGRYRVPNLPAGKYALQTVGNGLQSENAEVALAEGGKGAQDLALTATLNFTRYASSAEFATLLPEAEGKSVVVGMCTHCHAMGVQNWMLPRKTLEGWEETIQRMEHMPGQSLQISKPARALALEYLNQVAGVDAPPLDYQKLPKTLAKGAAAKAVVTEFVLPPNSDPHDVAVDSKGIGWGAGRGFLNKFDPKTLTVTRVDMPPPVPAQGIASGIEVDAQDRIWVVDDFNERLVAYDQKTAKFDLYPIPKPANGMRVHANTIRFQSNGTVWVTMINSNQILKWDPATKKVSAYNIPVPSAETAGTRGFTGSGNAYGMAVAKDDRVWFVQQRAEKVSSIANNGEMRHLDFPGGGIGISSIRRMASDNEGNLWIGHYGKAGKLVRLDSRSGSFKEFPAPTPYGGLYSVSMDRKNNFVWANEMLADRIARYDPRSGSWTEYQLPTRYSSARRIEVDPSRPTRVWFSGNFKKNVGFVDTE